jgi:hypothetical protein
MLFHVPAEAAKMIGPLDFFFHLTSRYESRRDVGFDEADEAHRTLWLNRGRLGFDYQPSPESNVRVTYQYAHINTKDEATIPPIWGGGGGQNSPDFIPTGDWDGRTRQDLVEAYVSRTWGMSTMTLGRQQVDRDWLVGSNNWAEVGRAWTGVRVENNKWDFFVGRLDLDTVGEAGGDQHLAFTGYDWGTWGRTTLYYKLDRFGESIYTLGHEYKKNAGTVDFSLNGATQWGRTGGNDLSAYAGVAKAKLNMGTRMSLFGAYSLASGGTTDAGTVRTFDDLYPSDHHRLGIMDHQSLRNVQAFSVGLGYDVNDEIGLKVAYHSFKLFDGDDFWYQPGDNFQYNVGPGDGTDIGNEIDITLSWMLNPALKLHGGFAIFDPGSAIQNAGGGTDNQTFMYVGLNFRY